MGDYTRRTSNAEVAEDSVLSHKYVWPKYSTMTEADLPKPAMSDTVAELEAAMLAEEEPTNLEPRQKTGGRQKGTPNKMARIDIMKAARIYSLQALGTLVDIMKDEAQPGATRVAAANSVLDRAYGKAKQITEIGGFDGGDIQTKLTIEFVGGPGQQSVQAAITPLPVAGDATIIDGSAIVTEKPKQPAAATGARPWE